jgi:HEAT repeat protein
LATPVLLKAFQEEERGTAWCVADGLIDLDDRTIIPHLVALYDDPSAKWGLQARILYVLGRMRAREARVLIDKGLEHSYWHARARAVELLWLLAPVEDAEEILSSKLAASQKGPTYDSKWDDEYLQRRLVTALGRVGSVQSLDILQQFKGEYLPTRPQPTTDEDRRARWRLEESLDQSARDLRLRQYGGTHP